jgi:hypothetical protein
VVATPREEIVMPIIATVILVLVGLCSITAAARAESANACKQCRDQQQACTQNYSAKTCKTEYDICMKSCQKNSRIARALTEFFTGLPLLIVMPGGGPVARRKSLHT